MANRSHLRRLLLCSAVMISGAAMPSMAQDIPADSTTSSSTGDADIVVTGSRIRSPNLESVSPVTTVAAEEFAVRGTVRTEDLVNQLPQVFAAQGAANSNEATGTAQVDLRGLSPSRTLVLINGRRLPYGSPKNIPSDLNQVPTPLIQSVEVLTGGASAVYGSDAIAGVVNFKLMDNFSGIRFTGSIAGFQHTNDRDELRDLLDRNNANVPGAYLKPDKGIWNGFTTELSAVAGGNIGEGRGNVTAYATYRKVNPILQADYDYSACALGASGPGGADFSCSGSATNAPANFTNAGGIPGLPTSFRATGDSQFVPGTLTYNFAPYNYYQRPDERYALGAMAHYEVNENFTPYIEASFMEDRSVAQIAPGTNSAGITVGAGSISGINCDNPFLSAQQASFLCTSRGLSTGSIYDASGNYVGPQSVAQGVLVARRNVEGGNRQDDIQHQSYRIVLGARGDIAGPFKYDVYGIYSKVSYRSRFSGDANRQRTANAFNAVRNSAGQIVCAINADANPNNNDANCSPLDYFGPQASADAVDYVAEVKSITGDTNLVNVVAAVDGDLGEWGIKSPLANSGVAVAFGYEFRKNSVDYQPDEIYQAAASPELPINGSVSVKEFFGELIVPLVEQVPFVQSLSFEGAYRYSDYDSGFKTDTYKLGLNWSPVDDFRFRGSYQRAVRAPNVIELFSSQQLFEVELTENADGSYDPCSGANPIATLEQCARTGVTAAQYGNIVDNPAGQFNSLIGGNPDLDPETAKTLSLGAVFEPRFVRGLTISVDYFDIEVENLVGSVNPNLSIANCLANGDPYFCSLIQRSPQSGSLWQGENGYFRRFNVNTGSLQTKGVDVVVDYRMNLNDLGLNAGRLNFNLVGTYLDSYKTVPLPNSPESDIYECKGLYAGLCGRPRPEWRHKFMTTWAPADRFSLTATWRYVSSVKIAQTSDQPALTGSFSEVNRELGARSYFDLAASFEVRKDFTFRAGINNLFDKDPPLTTTAAIEDGGNGNTYPQFYDATGRYLFLSASVGF
ncbi:TonB-dependent Receptor Plug Domain [Sphingomonas sp. OV641]|uniref:TonB-dependent receptor domain-containing protein n=2 Tax=unclassified Sphingomonas TaxID=196159 RepID=UPI0008D6CAB2|nr:TonB-dependent receptor [Sphingomonas sp. OV641]SEI73195.1 TonB-dependent Receptor Plug Domain [Sphingomonas sp. OV641]